MSFKDQKPTIIQEGYYYSASEMDVYLAVVEPKAEKLDAITLQYGITGDHLVNANEIIQEIEETKLLKEEWQGQKKLDAIKEQVLVPQLKDSKEYLDAHTKPEPHDIVMSRYWLEKGIYGTVFEIMKILGGAPLMNTGYTRMKVPPGVLRKCTQCGTEAIDEMDLENFMKRKSAPHGRGNLCKDCHNLRSRLRKKERFS